MQGSWHPLHDRSADSAGKQGRRALEVFSPQPYAFNANDISALQQLTEVFFPPDSRRDRARLRGAINEGLSPRTRQRPSARPAEVRTVSAARPVTAVKPSGQRRWHKILLVSAIATLFRGAVADRALDLKPDALIQRVRNSSGASFFESPTCPFPPTICRLAQGGRTRRSGGAVCSGRALRHRGRGQTGLHRGGRVVHSGGRARTHPGPGDFGRILLGGRGVPQDLTKAYYWSVLAPAETRPAIPGGCARLPHEPEPGAGGATAGERLAQ